MSPKVLNIAVVGTGIFATDSHLPTIQKISNLKPSAAFNRTKAKAETFAKKAGFTKVYDTLEEAFKDDEIDFVDALLPVQYNVDAVKLAIQYNKPICLEKPIAANLTQAREIVQLSKKSDLPIMILENWSFRKSIPLLKELLPKLGEVVSFSYHATGGWNDDNKYLNTSWRLKPEHVGGYLSDGGVHQLALLTDVLGEVESVSALTKQIRKESGDSDTLFSTLKLKSNVIGTFTYGSAFGATDKVTTFTIYGTEGSLVYDFSPALAKPTITYQTGASAQKTSGKTVVEVDEGDTLEEEFRNFAAAVEANDKSLVVVPPQNAFHHLAIISAAVDSAKLNGGSVKVEQA